jgi:hypothetical protein
MAVAVELAPSYKPRGNYNETGTNSIANRPFGGKKGRRIDCPKCKKWHWEDEKCPGNNPNRNGNSRFDRSKTPKVNEGTMPEIPEEDTPYGSPAVEESNYDRTETGTDGDEEECF